MVWEGRFVEDIQSKQDISTNHHLLNELINDGRDCRTAPATPGLLNIALYSAQNSTALNNILYSVLYYTL